MRQKRCAYECLAGGRGWEGHERGGEGGRERETGDHIVLSCFHWNVLDTSGNAYVVEVRKTRVGFRDVIRPLLLKTTRLCYLLINLSLIHI